MARRIALLRALLLRPSLTCTAERFSEAEEAPEEGVRQASAFLRGAHERCTWRLAARSTRGERCGRSAVQRSTHASQKSARVRKSLLMCFSTLSHLACLPDDVVADPPKRKRGRPAKCDECKSNNRACGARCPRKAAAEACPPAIGSAAADSTAAESSGEPMDRFEDTTLRVSFAFDVTDSTWI